MTDAEKVLRWMGFEEPKTSTNQGQTYFSGGGGGTMTEKRRRKSKVKIEFNEAWAAARLNNDRLTLAELANEIGMSQGQLHKRLTDAGWRTGWVFRPEWRRR